MTTDDKERMATPHLLARRAVLTREEHLLHPFGGRSVVEITHCIEPPLASKTRQPISIPARAFIEVCRAWARQLRDGEDVTRRGVRVREVHVFVDTGRRVPQGRSFRQAIEDAPRSRYAIRLSYGRHWFCMWRVTWEYIVANATQRAG